MKFSEFVRKRIKEHRETYNGEITDFIHAYMKEMQQGRNPDIFDDQMLQSLITDFFFAGSETTTSTLRWALLAMAAYPEIQRKLQEELDLEIGNRDVSMSDKKNTHYAEAVLCEIQRHFTLIHIGVPHSNKTNEIRVNGYRIPKNSFIVANLNAIHHDKRNWKNPNNFEPENFLEDGKVANQEKLIPFGIGRRSCAGEALARMELYLFFTSLVKNFEIRLEKDGAVPDMVGRQVGINQPRPFKVRMISRQ
jgi:cytochrome P450 family 2 subfamily J